MLILGIETSCDETAAAVVKNGKQVLSNVVHSQISTHRPYGGVVPELASRAHLENLPEIINASLNKTSKTWPDLDGIAVTYGPGLASSLIVGVSMARGLAFSSNLPLWKINHLEGHIASLFLGEKTPEPEKICPLLILLVSGGHTALIYMNHWGEYRTLGQTLDDAAGEALDKGARLLELGYPGGPEIEKLATCGNPQKIKFPCRMKIVGNERVSGGFEKVYCFSFSGLKTSLLYYLRDHSDSWRDERNDIAASYQQAVIHGLITPLETAIGAKTIKSLACVGGVARNSFLRSSLVQLAEKHQLPLLLTAPAYCTDNAAMIAAAAARSNLDISAAGEFDIAPSLRI